MSTTSQSAAPPTPHANTPQHHTGSTTLWDAIGVIPAPYQIFALCATTLLWLDETSVVDYVVKRLHTGLGTQHLWPSGYRQRLDDMSLHGRLGFAVYAVALLAISLLAHVALKQARVRFLPPSSKLLGTQISAHFFAPNNQLVGKVIVGMMLLEVICVVHETLMRIDDLGSHWLTQADALYDLVVWWGANICIPALMVFLYRLARDTTHRRCAAMRWHLVCFVVARGLLTAALQVFPSVLTPLSHITPGQDTSNVSILAQWLWSVVTVGVINHTYGLENRAGYFPIGAESVQTTVLPALSYSCLRFAVMYLQATLLTLTVMVGVHVIELLLLWLGVFLVVMWIPAAIEAASTDVFASFGCLAGLLASYVSGYEAYRSVGVAIVVFTAFFMVSVVHRLVTHAIGPSFAFAMLFAIPLSAILVCERKHIHQAASAEGLRMVGRTFLRVVRLTLDERTPTLSVVGLATSVPIACRVLGPKYPCWTLTEISHRCIHSLVLLAVILSSCGVARYTFSTMPAFLLTELRALVGFSTGCTTLGILLEAKDTVYQHALRVLGI